jgi:ParB family chromosome partitioning protein
MTTSGTIIDVDPKTLVIAANVRPDPKLNADLIASIKDIGILQPPMVVANDAGGYDVVIGQRRTLAAAQAGLTTIPVYLVTAREAEAAQLVDQMAENEQRLALTNAERAGGYQKLALFGMSVDEIAKKSRVPKKLVESAIIVAGNEKVSAVVTAHEIDLEQAAEIVEFADDKKTLEALTETARTSPHYFQYRIAEARLKRDNAAAKKDLTQKLKADRVTIVKAGDYPSWGTSAGQLLSKLKGKNGKDLTMSAHKKCPGHAAFVDVPAYGGRKAAIVYVCTDYEANGHTLKNASPALTPEQIAEREAAEEARNKAEADRTIVRQLRTDFITTLLQRKTLPATGVDRVIALGLTGTPAYEASRYNLHAAHTFALAFLQIDHEGNDWAAMKTIAETVDGSANNEKTIALAVALGHFEWYARTYGDQVTVTYFETLASWGHQLAELEETIIRQVKEATTAGEAAAAAAAESDSKAEAGE